MKLRKLLAVTAVAATMTAAFAVSAMAETTNNLVSGTDFTYDAKTGIITLTTDKQPSAAPYTMLVVASDEDDLDKTIADTDIKQIDQADAAFTTINVGTLAEGTYEIRLGGDGDVRWGTLEVKGAEDDNRFDNPNILLGSIDKDDVIDTVDLSYLIGYVLDPTSLTGDSLQAADVDDDGVADTVDASYIISYVLNPDDSFLGAKVIGDKVNLVPETTTAE